MFSGLIGIIGFKAFFVLFTLFATLTVPTGLILRKFRPIIGYLITWIGVVVQVAFGLIVAAATMSTTVLAYFVG